jgi:hypothetical protein
MQHRRTAKKDGMPGSSMTGVRRIDPSLVKPPMRLIGFGAQRTNREVCRSLTRAFWIGYGLRRPTVILFGAQSTGVKARAIAVSIRDFSREPKAEAYKVAVDAIRDFAEGARHDLGVQK